MSNRLILYAKVIKETDKIYRDVGIRSGVVGSSNVRNVSQLMIRCI